MSRVIVHGLCGLAIGLIYATLLSRASAAPPVLSSSDRQQQPSTSDPANDLSLKQLPDPNRGYSSEYDPDKLYMTARLGAWGISLSGKTGVRNLEASVNESFSDLIDDANFAAFPSFDISKGNWLLAFNGLYANLSESEHIAGPLDHGFGADITENMGIVDVGIGYTIVRATTTTGNPITLTPMIGGRWTYLDLEVDPENLPSRSVNRGWFDPYIGLQCTVGLTRNLDWRAGGTVGGFGVGSQFTWSAATMFEWHFSEHVGLDIGYRVLAWDYDLGDFKWDMTLQGPWIGLCVNF